MRWAGPNRAGISRANLEGDPVSHKSTRHSSTRLLLADWPANGKTNRAKFDLVHYRHLHFPCHRLNVNQQGDPRSPMGAQFQRHVPTEMLAPVITVYVCRIFESLCLPLLYVPNLCCICRICVGSEWAVFRESGGNERVDVGDGRDRIPHLPCAEWDARAED